MSSFPVRRLRVRKVALCLLLILAQVCLSTGTPAYATGQGVPHNDTDAASQTVVLIGFTGVRWEDINEQDAPNLFAFTSKAAGANLVVKTLGETTCPTRGWLTLGSGVRTSGTCAQAAIDDDGSVIQWDSYELGNKRNLYKPHLGLLGSSLDESFGSDTILALGSGAGLALADSEGKVVGQYIDTVRVGDTVDANTSRVSVRDGLRYVEGDEHLILVDLGQVRYGKGGTAESTREGFEAMKAAFAAQNTALPDEARADLSSIDDAFGQVLGHLSVTMPNARILVASLADSQSSRAELSFFAARGLSNEESAAFVVSDSTRREGLIQTPDITATLISWLAPQSPQSQYLAGSPLVLGAQTDSLSSSLVGEQNRARLTRILVGPFYCLFLGLALVAALVAWRVLRRNTRDPHQSDRVKNSLAFATLTIALLPVASLLVNLVPWWDFPHPRLAFAGILALIAVMIAAIASVPALRGKSSFSVAIAGFVTAGVVMADVIIDSFTSYSLQFPSVLGAQPQVGGRFYGLSNATFAIFAAGLLIGLAVLVSAFVRQGKNTQAAVVIVVCGIIALCVDGLAVFGADFGGPPALTLGMAFLFLSVSGRKITAPRILVVLVMALGVSVFFSLLDYANPATQRSHLGRFIQSVKDGQLFSVLSRKISAAAFGLPAPLAFLIMIGVILVLVWLWKRYAPLHELRSRLTVMSPSPTASRADISALVVMSYSIPAVLVTLISATFINDSSITIPVMGGVVALMLYTSAFPRTQ